MNHEHQNNHLFHIIHLLILLLNFTIGSMGGAPPPPPPATTAGNHHSQPLYSPTTPPFCSNFTDESEKTTIEYSNRTNFGPVPSQIEVQNAIFDLQRAMNGLGGTNLEINEFGGVIEHCNYDSSGTLMKSMGEKRLLDAYYLMQTDPLVQRLVLSISLDREVWDAILKNDAVQDLQGSISLTAKEEQEEGGGGGIGCKQETNSTCYNVKWIFVFIKSKIIEFMEKLEILVFKRLHLVSKKTSSITKHDGILEEKVRSSLLLSIVTLAIVFVTRSIEA